MKKILVVTAMMAAFCAACSDTEKDCATLNGTERCDLSVNHGALACHDNVRYMNQNGAYVEYPCDAGYACVSNGVCSRMPECVDSAVPMACSGNTLVYCSGGVMRYEACAAHTVCNIDATTGNGACVPNPAAGVCEAGSYRCDINGGRQVCQDTGSGLNWVNAACGTGMVCSAGECVLENPCIPDDKRCYYDKATDSNLVQTCSADKVWKTSEVCSGETSACNNGTCVVPGSTGDNEESAWYDCSAEMCSLTDGSTAPCGEVCVANYGENSKAWCDDNYNVQCADSQPSGGDDKGGSSDYVDCTNDVCGANGETCLEICAENDYDTDKAWCDDEYVYCEDPTGGSSGGGSGEYTNCSADTCTMSDGSSMLCGDACEEFYGAGNEAWCTADGSVTCAPSDPSGGSSSGGGSSDYVDCTNDVCGANGETCLEICADNDYDTDKAWCDDQYVYCEDPTGGSSGGGSSDGPSVDKNSCNISNVAGIEPFGDCETSQSECEIHVCWEDIQYGGYYTEYLVCMDLSSYGSDYGYMWYPIDGIYMACNNNCAADSQSCDSQGGQYGQYTSN